MHLGTVEGEAAVWAEELGLSEPHAPIPNYVQAFVLAFLASEFGVTALWLLLLTRRRR